MTGYRTSPTAASSHDEGWEGWPMALDCVLSPTGRHAGGVREEPETPELAICELSHDPFAARTARGFTRTTLRAWGLGALLDDAELVIGELVINALRHGVSELDEPPGEHVTIILGLTRDALIIVVTDPSEDRPSPRDPDHGAEGGRGLQVVAGVSHRWGWAPLRSPGKAVWAGFRLPGDHGRALRKSGIVRTTPHGTVHTGARPYR
ncbi:ATP-binding protein [Sphaerisporangium sp. TRM90804]|uniref:ATP-binding protein n=1 Tax=Sphaerisporangium sp. TRM90804 TaxID=3031113 RepID=UPI00244CFD8D|nr:ATP-binding protein [Sphaerisporangium sp. TRM90804]MDH2424015.1 ATP-binding protein [Sphaerisporangium sp. TRM90804]